jgi:hypothetical protein
MARKKIYILTEAPPNKPSDKIEKFKTIQEIDCICFSLPRFSSALSAHLSRRSSHPSLKSLSQSLSHSRLKSVKSLLFLFRLARELASLLLAQRGSSPLSCLTFLSSDPHFHFCSLLLTPNAKTSLPSVENSFPHSPLSLSLSLDSRAQPWRGYTPR